MSIDAYSAALLGFLRSNPRSTGRRAPGEPRTDLHFDPSYLLEGARPSYDYLDLPAVPRDPRTVFRGKRVRWIGTPGTMLRVPAAYVLPTQENIFYPSHFAALYETIREQPVTYLRAPLARIHHVRRISVQETQEGAQDGRLDEWWMTRPWTRTNIGHAYARLWDGNHRAFAAILAGEPSVWVHVMDDYRDAVREHLR